MNPNRLNTTLVFLVTLLVLFLGVINIAIPFYGDQAFFMLGAKEMDDGMVLYRDFWDIKQPGIFFFFLIAGKTFGFSYVGIHLFEVFYWILFTIILIWYLTKFHIFKNNLLNYFAPLLVVGTYYSVSAVRTMTQVEILVNFPLMLVVISNTFYQTNKNNTKLWLFLSGFFGGIVLLFKIIFAPVLAILWLIILFREWNIKRLLLNSFSLLTGIILAWVPFFVYCFHYNILELCYNTFIHFPPLVLKYGQSKTVDHLLHSAYFFFSKLVFFILFVVYSLHFIRKQFLVTELWGWLLAGTIVVLLQKNSWYTYHFQILYTPIVILSLLAVDSILSRLSVHPGSFTRVSTISIFLLLSSIPVLYTLKKLAELSKFNFALTATDRLNFAVSQKDNALAYRISGHLSDKNDNCPIFVVNDPLVYYYTRRNQSTAQSGWSIQLFIPGQLEILQQELQKSRPCYIFLRREFDPFFNSKGSEILRWINQNYVKSYSDADGTWYKLI